MNADPVTALLRASIRRSVHTDLAGVWARGPLPGGGAVIALVQSVAAGTTDVETAGNTLETANAFVYRFEDTRIAEMWMICAAPAGTESFWD